MLSFLSFSIFMQFFKKFIFTFLTFSLLFSFFLWFLTKTINSERIKTFVKQKITALTNQPSEVKGAISWQLFPHPGIKIEKIYIGDKQAPNPYVITLGQLFFNLKISALLQGKLVFNEITMDHMIAEIDLSKQLATPTTVLSKADTELEEQFAIEKLLITHGKLRVTINNKILNLTSLKLGAEGINFHHEVFPMQLKTKIDYAFNQKHTIAQLQFKGDARFSSNPFTKLDDLLKSIFLKGQLLMQDMQAGPIKINKLSANTLVKNKMASLNPLTLTLYQGEAIGDLSYNFLSRVLKINQTATGINGSRFTSALFNQKLVKGSLDLSIHTQSNFNNDWLTTTTGNGNISLQEGTLEVIDLDQVINTVQDNKEIAQAFPKGITPLKLLSIQYQLDHAMLSSNAIVLQTNRLQLKGDGALNLTDYKLTSHLLTTLAAEGGGIPLIIQGNLYHPTVLFDLKKSMPVNH